MSNNLEGEEHSDEKSEFYQGEIFALAGSTAAHARITMSLGGEIYGALNTTAQQAKVAFARKNAGRQVVSAGLKGRFT